MRRWTPVVLPWALAACATAAEPGASAQGAALAQPVAETAPPGDTLVPPRYGTLHQDDFTVSLRSGALLIKVTPLAESVIRLAAPDTYDRLHALAENRREEARRMAGDEAELFLVSFFSYEPDVDFQPEDLQLTHRGRLARAIRILPITPGWGRQRLRQQETQTAIYVFEPGIDYGQAITVRYGLESSEEWSRVVPRLEAERARIRGRGSEAPGRTDTVTGGDLGAGSGPGSE